MFNFFSELKNKCKELSNKINPYQIVMVGSHLMYVEGKITLMTVDLQNMVFKVNEDIITVKGKSLGLKDITENTLTIVSKISS